MGVLHAAGVAERRLSGLGSEQIIASALQRERARTDRSGLAFSIVVFGPPQGAPRRQVLDMVRAVARRARETDEVGWYDKDKICAILANCPADGAFRFAHDVAHLLGEPLSDRICSIYSYPARPSKPVAVLNGNGHANGNSNGHANGNGHVNGHTNGNSNGHSNGNGHTNGHANGHATLTATRATDISIKPNAQDADHHRNSDAAALVPFMLEGFRRELGITSLPVGEIEPFIVRPLPLWKRTLDVVCASLALVVFAPVMLAVATAIRLSMGNPVIFRQRRTGLGGRPFTVYKFRTMIPDAEAKKAALRRFSEQDGPAFKMTVDPRVTPLGDFLRKSSLDELPQLWNVLKGDMSMVGPRPLPCEESDACEPWQRRRLDVTPGITCIWQVKGRSTVTFTEWVRMDLAYIRRRKLINDLVIMFQTIPAVLKRRGPR